MADISDKGVAVPFIYCLTILFLCPRRLGESICRLPTNSQKFLGLFIGYLEIGVFLLNVFLSKTESF